MNETSETAETKNRHKLVAKLEHIVQHFQSQRKMSRLRPRRQGLSGKAGYIFLSFGFIALVSSIIYESALLAFIGLSLTLWGGLFLFVKPARYVKANLLDSSIISSLAAIEKILTELNYQGQGIYLPRRHQKELREEVAFVPMRKEIIIPPDEEIAKGKTFMNPDGICLTPPGQSLLTLYEKELGKDLSRVNLSYLESNLPKLLVENLEILEDLEINEQNDKVHGKMKGSVYQDLCSHARNLTNICSRLGCPLCSSIVCTLAKATGKAVVIEKCELSNDEKIVEIWYHLTKL
jgi:hypothetical protein